LEVIVNLIAGSRATPPLNDRVYVTAGAKYDSTNMGGKARHACTFCLGATFPMCFLLGLALIAGGIALYMEYPSIIADQVNKVSW